MTQRKDEERVDRASEDSFPASDPPASNVITGPGVARPQPRPPSNERGEDDRPKGRPTDDRHAAQTAYQWEDEEKPGRKRR